LKHRRPYRQHHRGDHRFQPDRGEHHRRRHRGRPDHRRRQRIPPYRRRGGPDGRRTATGGGPVPGV